MRKFCILGFLAMAAVAAPGQARELRSSDIYPSNTPTGSALAYMGTVIERETNGRIKMRPPEDRNLDSENFTVAQVRTGHLDMARVSLPVLNATAPSTAVLSAPYIFGSSAALRRILDGPIGAEILAELEQHGLVGLCFYDLGSRSLYTVDKPVKSASDVKGLRLRSQPGDIAGSLWQSYGATAIAMPYSRLADGLRTHAIDGATGNWISYVSGGHYRFTKYFTPTEHARPPGIVIFSLQVWRELTEQDRVIILAAAKASAIREQELMDAYAKQARRTVEAAGVKIVEDVDMKSFTDPKEAIYDSLLSLPKQQDLFLRLRAAAPGM
jgi:TRAP-type C4-dicarboxylate transport system substrate-binding protein